MVQLILVVILIPVLILLFLIAVLVFIDVLVFLLFLYLVQLILVFILIPVLILLLFTYCCSCFFTFLIAVPALVLSAVPDSIHISFLVVIKRVPRNLLDCVELLLLLLILYLLSTLCHLSHSFYLFFCTSISFVLFILYYIHLKVFSYYFAECFKIFRIGWSRSRYPSIYLSIYESDVPYLFPLISTVLYCTTIFSYRTTLPITAFLVILLFFSSFYSLKIRSVFF